MQFASSVRFGLGIHQRYHTQNAKTMTPDTFVFSSARFGLGMRQRYHTPNAKTMTPDTFVFSMLAVSATLSHARVQRGGIVPKIATAIVAVARCAVGCACSASSRRGCGASCPAGLSALGQRAGEARRRCGSDGLQVRPDGESFGHRFQLEHQPKFRRDWSIIRFDHIVCRGN